MTKEPKAFDVLRFKGDWILVRADWPDYYNEHGVTDVSWFQRLPPGRYEYKFVVDGQWLPDPTAQENVCNAHGTLNSAVEVRA